jgi:hypothetical protein
MIDHYTTISVNYSVIQQNLTQQVAKIREQYPDFTPGLAIVQVCVSLMSHILCHVICLVL